MFKGRLQSLLRMCDRVVTGRCKTSELNIFNIWNDNIQSSKQKNNEASTPVFDSDWTSVSVPQTSEFTRIGRQFHALSANRYTAGINSKAITKSIANSI